MKNRIGTAHLSTLVIAALAAILILFLFSDRISMGKPRTAPGRLARDAALSLEEISLGRIDGSESAAVVRQQLLSRRRRENEEWTESNIRRHPDLYLDHCQEMLTALKEECADALFTARVRAVRNEREAAEAGREAVARRAFLAAAEKLSGNGGPTFPLKIGDYIYDATEYTNAVREADGEAAKAERAAALHQDDVRRARELEEFLEQTIADIDVSLADLAKKRDSLRADTARKSAEEIRESIDALMDAASVAAPGRKESKSRIEETPPPPTLEEIFTRNRAAGGGHP